MPRKHRDFLAEVEKLPTLRSFVEANASDDNLRGSYDGCMKQLRLWRGQHIALVSKYIVTKSAISSEPMQGLGIFLTAFRTRARSQLGVKSLVDARTALRSGQCDGEVSGVRAT